MQNKQVARTSMWLKHTIKGNQDKTQGQRPKSIWISQQGIKKIVQMCWQEHWWNHAKNGSVTDYSILAAVFMFCFAFLSQTPNRGTRNTGYKCPKDLMNISTVRTRNICRQRRYYNSTWETRTCKYVTKPWNVYIVKLRWTRKNPGDDDNTEKKQSSQNKGDKKN